MKLTPYFTVESTDIAAAIYQLHKVDGKSRSEIHDMVCDFFQITYDSRTTQVSYASYYDILGAMSTKNTKWFASLIVEAIQKENVNVLSAFEKFLVLF